MKIYLDVLKDIIEHLRFHLSLEAFRSRKKLKSLRNSCLGKKDVIMCNGPSLLETDFESLSRDDIIVIGLNKVNLLFDKTDLRPDFIVAVNHHVIEQNKNFYNETEIPLFLSCQNWKKNKYVKNRGNVIHLMNNEMGRGPRNDITWSILEGSTVTTPALQVALHLGCAEIALVGCDHNFATKGEANKEVVAGDLDPNHFDPNYFAGGVKWHLPDLLGSEISYLRVLRLANTLKIPIWNCTVGGNLELFSRKKLIDFLNPDTSR